MERPSESEPTRSGNFTDRVLERMWRGIDLARQAMAAWRTLDAPGVHSEYAIKGLDGTAFYRWCDMDLRQRPAYVENAANRMIAASQRSVYCAIPVDRDHYLYSRPTHRPSGVIVSGMSAAVSQDRVPSELDLLGMWEAVRTQAGLSALLNPDAPTIRQDMRGDGGRSLVSMDHWLAAFKERDFIEYEQVHNPLAALQALDSDGTFLLLPNNMQEYNAIVMSQTVLQVGDEAHGTNRLICIDLGSSSPQLFIGAREFLSAFRTASRQAAMLPTYVCVAPPRTGLSAGQ